MEQFAQHCPASNGQLSCLTVYGTFYDASYYVSNQSISNFIPCIDQQHCPGDFSNLMYSFGGTYDGYGVKSDFASWIDSPDLVANYDASHKSIDPRRASYKMFLHVSSRPDNCLSVPIENKVSYLLKLHRIRLLHALSSLTLHR